MFFLRQSLVLSLIQSCKRLGICMNAFIKNVVYECVYCVCVFEVCVFDVCVYGTCGFFPVANVLILFQCPCYECMLMAQIANFLCVQVCPLPCVSSFCY